MKTHRFNNAVVPGGDCPQRIISVLDGAQLSSDEIARRLGKTRGAIHIHLRRLVDSGVLVRRCLSRRRVYVKGSASAPILRKASGQFAGRITIGRGLANW